MGGVGKMVSQNNTDGKDSSSPPPIIVLQKTKATICTHNTALVYKSRMVT